jgi:hypothetical protein
VSYLTWDLPWRHAAAAAGIELVTRQNSRRMQVGGFRATQDTRVSEDSVKRMSLLDSFSLFYTSGILLHYNCEYSVTWPQQLSYMWNVAAWRLTRLCLVREVTGLKTVHPKGVFFFPNPSITMQHSMQANSEIDHGRLYQALTLIIHNHPIIARFIISPVNEGFVILVWQLWLVWLPLSCIWFEMAVCY